MDSNYIKNPRGSIMFKCRTANTRNKLALDILFIKKINDHTYLAMTVKNHNEKAPISLKFSPSCKKGLRHPIHTCIFIKG